ncbi:MAG: hypothetical protein GWO02_17550, partial [Gammaproteobacteria bacterium]|nr:hypothetical protein [Gammaproteobacteria bacterium]
MAYRFGWDSVAFRFVLALVVVFATWNPLGWSFWHWSSADPVELTPA